MKQGTRSRALAFSSFGAFCFFVLFQNCDKSFEEREPANTYVAVEASQPPEGSEPRPPIGQNVQTPSPESKRLNQTHLAMFSSPSIPSIGPISRGHYETENEDCDYYPATNHSAGLLSGVILSQNEKFSYDLYRQLAYAHSLDNHFGLLARYTKDATESAGRCLAKKISRDAQMRQIFSFYFAYKVTGNRLFLKWADRAVDSVLMWPREPITNANFPGGTIPSGFRGGSGLFTRSVFSHLYSRIDESGNVLSSWNPGGSRFRPESTPSLDANQLAETGLAFWLLYQDTNSRHYGSSSVKQIIEDHFVLASALQVTNPSTPYFLQDPQLACRNVPSYTALNPSLTFGCERPIQGSFSLTDGPYLWAWDDVYATFTYWAFAISMGQTPSAVATSSDTTVQLIRSVLTNAYPYINSRFGSDSLRLGPRRFYSSDCNGTSSDPDHCRHGFPYVEKTNAQEAWMWALPTFFHANRLSSPAPAAGDQAPCSPSVRDLVTRLQQDSITALGNVEYHSYLILAGIPDSCLITEDQKMSLISINEAAPIFVPRGNRIFKMGSVVSDYGHSVNMGNQEFFAPILDVWETSTELYVALAVSLGGSPSTRLIRYLKPAGGSSMLNVQRDGITTIPNFQKYYLGYQDFYGKITGLAFDNARSRLYLGVARNDTTGQVFIFDQRKIGSGAAMFYADRNLSTGLSEYLPQYSQVKAGDQAFSTKVNGLAVSGPYLFVGLESGRLIKYKLSSIGAGTSAFYVGNDGVSSLPGYSTQHQLLAMGYHDFSSPVLHIHGDSQLFVAVKTNAGSRLLRISAEAIGSGATFLYADATGTRPLPGWEDRFTALHLAYQDFDGSIKSISASPQFIFVNVGGKRIGVDPTPVLLSIKYHRNDSTGSNMWWVGNDGTTRIDDCMVGASCSPRFPWSSPNYSKSMIEYAYTLDE